MKNSFFLLAILLIACLGMTAGAQGSLHYPGDAFECKTCHGPHLSQVNAPLLISGNTVEEFCIGCHGPLGPASAPVGVHEDDPASGHGFNFRISCNVCHNPHRNENLPNIKNIRKEIKYGSFSATGRKVNYRSRNDFVLKNSEPGYYGICEVCHKNTLHHKDNGLDSSPTHYKKWWGTTQGRSLPVCMACHPHDDKFHKYGNQHCVDCHAVTQNGGIVNRKAVVPEFSANNNGHHASNPPSNLQCLVCHEVLEHRKGIVRLKDPDDDTTIITLTKFVNYTDLTRTAQDSLMNNFCFKCHDAGGATDEDNYKITGTVATQTKPFNTSSVPNVSGQFDTTNFAFHPVKGYKGGTGNDRCTSLTMVSNSSPNGQNYGYMADNDLTINCWDCHAVSGHGGVNTDILLKETYADNPSVGQTFENAQNAFCTMCHKPSSYLTGSNNSGFKKHDGEGHPDDKRMGCRNCHAGLLDRNSGSGTPSGVTVSAIGKGNIHGYSYIHNGFGNDGTPSAARYFLLGGYVSKWTDSYQPPKRNCWGGQCDHNKGKGKDYTRQ